MTDDVIRVVREVPQFLGGFSTPHLQAGDVACLPHETATLLVSRGHAVPVACEA